MNEVERNVENSKDEGNYSEEDISSLLNKSIGTCDDAHRTETVFYTAAQAYASELYRQATECVTRVKVM